jgi:uncharacterized protein
MVSHWLPLKDIPASGRVFSFTDQSLWTENLERFHLGMEIRDPLEAELRVIPQKDGVSLSGRITGALTAACDRCAREVVLELDQRFDEYEMLGTAAEEDEEEPAEESRLRQGDNSLELDVASVLWEQFLLALPVKPLCVPECRGLCPHCGQDLNESLCACDEEEADPRMAPLRNLKIS